MFTDVEIKNVLKRIVEAGIKHIAIWPYGQVGMRAKLIADEYFEFEDIIVIDKEYCKYSRRIISPNSFLSEQGRKDGQMVLVCVENEDIASEICSLCSSSKVQYINLLANRDSRGWLEKVYIGEEGKRKFDYKNIFRTAYINEINRVKVRVLFSNLPFWNHCEPIINAFNEDEFFDTAVIIHDKTCGEDIERMRILVEGCKCKYVLYEKYTCEDDLPDIIISCGQGDWNTYLDNIRNIAKLIVVFSPHLIPYLPTVKDVVNNKNFLKVDKEYQPDFYCYDSYMFNLLKNSDDAYFLKDRLVEMGSPKYDGIYRACKNNNNKSKWEKLSNRKTVLWTTTHGAYGNLIDSCVTFDLFAKDLLDYFKNSDLGLIFRPHPQLLRELKLYYNWKQCDIDNIISTMSESSNMVFDLDSSYEQSYSVADAIIGDLNSGIMLSALPMEKPILGLYRPEVNKEQLGEYTDAVYTACNYRDIEAFIKEVVLRADSLYDTHQQYMRKMVKHFDGYNGLRFKEFVKQKYCERI